MFRFLININQGYINTQTPCLAGEQIEYHLGKRKTERYNTDLILSNSCVVLVIMCGTGGSGGGVEETILTGVGNGGGGGGKGDMCPHFFDWGGGESNGIIVPPTFNPTFLFSTWIICLYNTDT